MGDPSRNLLTRNLFGNTVPLKRLRRSPVGALWSALVSYSACWQPMHSPLLRALRAAVANEGVRLRRTHLFARKPQHPSAPTKLRPLSALTARPLTALKQ
jgi:hypothetical protein